MMQVFWNLPNGNKGGHRRDFKHFQRERGGEGEENTRTQGSGKRTKKGKKSVKSL